MGKSNLKPVILWGNDGRKRAERIPEIITAIRGLGLPPDFSIVDIACGEGEVLIEIKKEFPECRASGIDILGFPSWPAIPQFTQMSLQEFIRTSDQKYDVVMMLNSYRNWPDKHEFDKWIRENAHYFIYSIMGSVIGTDTHGYPLILSRN
jgi:hypothetical protein